MKNLKKMVLSGAFVLAVVGAFAFQGVEKSNTSEAFAFTVYQTGACSTPITHETCGDPLGTITCDNLFLESGCNDPAKKQ